MVRAAWSAGAFVFGSLLLLYLASLAPRVTFWDAGEFIAAIDSWGIPHPPGTPLYVTLGNAAHALLPGVPTAIVANALSALCTAAACALGSVLLVRAGTPVNGAIGAGICAGCMTTVWLSATEAEVYSVSLLLSAAMLVAAHRAAVSQRNGAEHSAGKWRALVVYLFAMAAPLHASALVAGPAAVWLTIDDGGARWAGDRVAWRAGGGGAAVMACALIAAGGLATGRFVLAGVAFVAFVALRVHRRAGAWRTVGAFALGATPLLILLLRARHDPAINQGNPADWRSLADVIGRRQYEVAGLFPRQAPPWIQLGNFLQYADWQFALGLAPESTPSIPRIVVSLCFVALGVIGAREHRLRDARTFRAMLVLLVSGSIGVIAYLNLKAGPSIGWGILPDSMPHEARERDYFFALAFWVWGLWAGLGAVTLATRRAGDRRALLGAAAGLALAALPAALNWQAMNRRRQPDASAAARFSDALLASVPPNGVVIVWGDNDTYPLWEAQRARALRRDVTIITSPLLGAAWYRDELRRRWRIDAGALANERDMVVRATVSARSIGRPVAMAVTVPAVVRQAAGGEWSLCGLAWIEGSSRCGFLEREALDLYRRDHPVGRYTDNTVRSMIETLDCPALGARPAGDPEAADSLARACNTR